MIERMTLLALLVLSLPASAQDIYTLDSEGNIVYGAVETETRVEGLADGYLVPLAPGEEIIGLYAAPSIVRMPAEAEILYETLPYDPPVEIDRVTGLPRNETGWTGAYEEPLGIGCFPQGVCAELND